MLIDFTVENFRSYREPKTLSLVASSSDELHENLVQVSALGKSLVRVAAVYGANASGKSNLLEAMNALSGLLANPVDRSFMEVIELPPFALDAKAGEKPSRFKVRFLLEEILFDYSIAARPGLIEEEQMIAYPSGRPQEWFTRSGTEITLNRTHLKGPRERLKELMAPHAPFLAIAATFGHPQLTPPARWIGKNLNRRFTPIRLPGLFEGFGAVGQRCADYPEFHQWINHFLSHADLGIRSIEIETKELPGGRIVPQRMSDGRMQPVFEELVSQNYEPRFVHVGANGSTAKFPIESESHGTRQFFALLPFLYDVFRSNGDQQVVLIDEFGESMHPSLAREIVRLFQNPKTNASGAQLVFTTHDTSLLSGQLFRRDQIWFTEKDPSGATDLYSLHDIKNVRPDEAFEKGYLRGRYGAIPFFGSFDFPQVHENGATKAPTPAPSH